MIICDTETRSDHDDHLLWQPDVCRERAQQYYECYLQCKRSRIDKFFGCLLLLQWLAAVISAGILTPLSWEGSSSYVHIHVWTALWLGAVIALPPVFMVQRHPGEAVTRQCVAVAQALFSALFIHISGGRIETHFHVFASLALLAFYRDWRVLLTASSVVALDHVVRGIYIPESLYNTGVSSPWRWLEHISWVAAEDICLSIASNQNLQELRQMARRQAELEDSRESEKRISEFYSTISHELRTPLTSIRGALSLIDDGTIDASSAEGRELISIGLSSSKRLIRLINEILDLRKIEAGHMAMQLQHLEPRQAVESAVDAMRGMASEFGVSLVTSCSAKRSVSADPDRISQVLTNLISNALKFSPEGGTVVVSTSETRGGVRFSVKDHGPGIPHGEQHKLFTKFQQVDSSDTRATGGTGLGLAISKAIVEQHHGKIGFVSHPGCGSTFFFELEAEKGTSEENLIFIEDSEGKDLILIVEDDEELSQLLSSHFDREGYR